MILKKISMLTAVVLASALLANVPQVSAESELDIIEDCGTTYGYDYLGKMSDGEIKQKLYKDMYDHAIEIWNSDEDFELDKNGDCIFDVYSILDYKVQNVDDLLEVFITLKGDNPIFYYLSNYYMYTVHDLYVKIDPEYITAEARKKAQKDILEYISETDELLSKEDTLYGKTKAMHDKLIDECEYEYEEDGETPSKRHAAHNILGMIQDNTGVCESYSKTFELMMNYEDVDNLYISGLKSGGAHAWNLAKLDDGKYYYFDCTADESFSHMTEMGIPVDFFLGAGMEKINILHTQNQPTGKGKDFLVGTPQVPTKSYGEDSGDEPYSPDMPDPPYEILQKDMTFDVDEFLGKCSTRYSYEELGKRENGENLQKCYDEIYGATLEFMNRTFDYAMPWVDPIVYADFGLGEDPMAVFEVLEAFRNDNPQFFFVSYEISSLTGGVIINSVPEFDDVSPRWTNMQNMYDYVTQTAEELSTKGTDYEKVCALHDKIINDAEYIDSNNVEDHHVISIIRDNKGVSEAYARTMQLVLNYMGIENYNVQGRDSSGSRQLWNLVKLDDGRYYYVDCAKDEVTSSKDYLAAGSDKILKDHTINSPDKSGEDYLCKLPEASKEDYDPNKKPDDSSKPDGDSSKPDDDSSKPDDNPTDGEDGKSYKMGDVNGDGKIDIEDAAMIINHVNGVKALTDDQAKRADVDGSEKIDIEDAVRVISHINGVKVI